MVRAQFVRLGAKLVRLLLLILTSLPRLAIWQKFIKPPQVVLWPIAKAADIGLATLCRLRKNFGMAGLGVTGLIGVVGRWAALTLNSAASLSILPVIVSRGRLAGSLVVETKASFLVFRLLVAFVLGSFEKPWPPAKLIKKVLVGPATLQATMLLKCLRLTKVQAWLPTLLTVMFLGLGFPPLSWPLKELPLAPLVPKNLGNCRVTTALKLVLSLKTRPFRAL